MRILTLLLLTTLTASARGAELEIDSVVVNLIAEAEVPAEEAGALAEIAVREGQRVKTGDLLARIDDRDAALEVAKAKIVLSQANDQAANDIKHRRAQQTLKLAKLELKKSEEANQELEKVVSPTQIEKLKIDIENALLEIEQAEKDIATARRGVEAATNDLRIAERAVERRRMASPLDGVVVEIRRNQGEWLKPGEPLVRVVRDDRLRAEGFIHVDKLTADPMHCDVQLLMRSPEGKTISFPGKVVFVSPVANPINGQVRIRAEVENKDGKLRAGTAGRMIVQLSSPTP